MERLCRRRIVVEPGMVYFRQKLEVFFVLRTTIKKLLVHSNSPLTILDSYFIDLLSPYI